MRTPVHARKSAAAILLTLIMLAGAATTLSACNMAAGFGQDMSAAGNALSNSAEKARNGE